MTTRTDANDDDMYDRNDEDDDSNDNNDKEAFPSKQMSLTIPTICPMTSLSVPIAIMVK